MQCRKRVKGAFKSCGLFVGIFCICLIPALIFAGIAASMLSPSGVDGCDPDARESSTSALCHERVRYGDFGTMFIFMLSSFAGTTYIDFVELSTAAGDGSDENHWFSILAILMGLLGKVWLASWAILSIRSVAPASKRAATKSCVLLVGLFVACLLPLVALAGIAAALLSPSGVEGGCGSNLGHAVLVLCKERARYGDGGTMFVLMLSSFAGVTYLDFAQISSAAGDGTHENHGLSLLVILAGLLGRGMIMSWAALTFHWFFMAGNAAGQMWEQQTPFSGGMPAQQIGAENNDKDLQQAIEESMKSPRSQQVSSVGVHI